MKTIREYASRILQLFVDCDRYSTGGSIPSFEDRHRSIISDFQGRFRSWCGFLGALQVGHASLDWRLRDSKNLSQSVISHLAGLIDDLDDCLDVLSPERQALEEHEYHPETTSDSGNSSSTDEPPDAATELNQHLLSLKCTLDNLYKLSFLIRNPKSRQSTLQKAESYGINFGGRGGDFFQDLQAGHHDRAAEFIRQLREEGGLSDSSKSPDHDVTILDRLYQASSKRQRQFAYWEDHSRKLSAEVPSIPSKQAQTEGVLDLSRLATGPGTILSGTEATSVQVFDCDAQSLAPSASTARGLNGTRVPLPKAPKLNDGQAEFQCPYCYVWCPASERRRWRKHLFEDLRPYMCTYLDCPTATELFSTRAEWLAHEKGLHLRAWKCRNHLSTTFASQKKFEDHLRSQHASMTDREIEASVKYSMATLEDTRAYCCMCLVTVSQLPRGQSLANHMAHHFETFARLSLPDHGSEDDDIESEDSESVSAGGEGPVVQQDADIDMPFITSDDFEDTAHPGEDMSIHTLAVAGDKYGMRVLLEKQSDINAMDEEGWTALQRAAYAGQSTILQMLLGAGADVGYPSGYYGNALQCAALQGHEELVRSLIEGGANVNQQGGYHGTALLAATCQGHKTTVKILLGAGARVDLPNDRHFSAIDCATHHGHGELVQSLELEATAQRGQQKLSGITTTPDPTSLGRENTQLPWQYSSTLGCDFVWTPRSDEIILKTGEIFRRPPHILIESVRDASYDGPVPDQYSGDQRLRTIPQGDVEVVFRRTTQSQVQGQNSTQHPDQHPRETPLTNAQVVSTLFPGFREREDPQHFFRVGRVFSVLWSEPAVKGTVITPREADISADQLGGRVFSKVRRFVVIREGSRFCHALPISTYSGRGVSSGGVVKSDHAIIHSSPSAPRPQQAELPGKGESGMQPVPIRVELDHPSDALNEMSRVNLGGVTMVQHNIKLQSLGKVCETSIRDLQRQSEDVWRQDLPTRQTDVRPAIDDESDDDEDESDEEQSSDESSAYDEGEQRHYAQLAHPMDDDPGSGTALLHRDATAQGAGSATAMEKVQHERQALNRSEQSIPDHVRGINSDASSSRTDVTAQLQVSASREQLDQIYHEHLRNMNVLQDSSASTDTPPSIRAETLKSPEPDMRAPAHGSAMDSIPSYRLSRKIVEEELLKMFPELSNAALGIKEEDDVFTFRVPRMLTSEQKRQIWSKRMRDHRERI